VKGFIKADTGSKGEVCEFHTFTFAQVNFGMLPDELGEGGANSTIVVSSFTSKAFYDANRGNKELAIKNRTYGVNIMELLFLRAIDTKSAEQRMYDIVIAQDPWFADAMVVT